MVSGSFFANKNAASILANLDDDERASSKSGSAPSNSSVDNTYIFPSTTAVVDASKLADVDVVPSKLQANLLTKVASDYLETNTRATVATNDTFISYGLKQGHIRVLHRYSEARALLKGHTSPIASLTFLSSHVIASGGRDGKVFVWELKESEDENALGVECVMRAVFSPGCEDSDVFVARGGMHAGGMTMVATAGSSVMVIDMDALRVKCGNGGDGDDSEALLDIDPLDPAPYGSRLAGFPLQDTPTCVSTSKRGVVAVGSKRGRVYVAQLGAGGGVDGRVVGVEVDGGSSLGGVCGVDWVGPNDLIVSVEDGRKKVLYAWDGAAASLRAMDSLTLEDSDRKEPYVHTSVVAKRRLACLADTRNNSVYVVRVGKERFVSLEAFEVGKPILSMFACWNTEAGKLELTCVQTDAITQYYVDYDGREEADEADEVEEAEEERVEEVIEKVGAMVMTTEEMNATAHEVATQESAAVNVADQVPLATLSVSDEQPAESAEDFSLMSALLTPSDIMSTAEIKSTDSSKEKDVGHQNTKTVAEKTETTKVAKKKKKKKAAADIAPAPAPIKVLKRVVSNEASLGDDGTNSPSGESEDGVDTENEVVPSIPADLLGEDASPAALFLAICEQNAKQAKMVDQALEDHRKYVDLQISRVLKDMDKKSSANKKAMEASLQTAVKDSIRTILPKEVFGAVKTGLDKQLAGAVQQGLSKTVQESFKQSFMKQIVPAFEAACQNMLTQFDGTLAQHLKEVTATTKDALSSVAKAAASAAASAGPARQASSNHGQPQSPHSVQSGASPKEEIQNLLRAGNLEQAFRKALSLQDLGILGWVCASVDAPSVLARTPAPLSQMVLLSLLQQLSHDLSQQTTSKLQWIREAAMNINPQDPAIAHQVKPVLQQVANSLTSNVQNMSPSDASNCKLTIHVVRSQMVG